MTQNKLLKQIPSKESRLCKETSIVNYAYYSGEVDYMYYYEKTVTWEKEGRYFTDYRAEY